MSRITGKLVRIGNWCVEIAETAIFIQMFALVFMVALCIGLLAVGWPIIVLLHWLGVI